MLFVAIVISVTNLYLASLMLKLRGVGKITLFSFSLFALCISIWVLATQLSIHTNHAIFGKVMFIAPVLGLALLSVFAKSLTKIRAHVTMLLLTPAIILTILISIGVVMRIITVNADYIVFEYYPAILLHKIFVLTYVPLTLYFIFKYYSMDKVKALWLAGSIMSFIIPATITNMLLPQVFGISQFNQYGPLFSIFMVGGITYAITTRKLFDIRPAVQRGVVYTTLLGVVIALFIALLFIFEHVFGEYIKIPHTLSGIITTMLGIFYGQYLIQRFTEITNRFFYKHPYKFKEAIVEIDTTMRTLTTRQEFIQNFFKTLHNIIKPEIMHLTCFDKERVYTDNNSYNMRHTYSPLSLTELKKIRDITHLTRIEMKKPMRASAPLLALHSRLGIEIFVPITHGNTHFGTLCLGARKSGDAYTKRDLKLLRIAANYAGIALKNIILYEKQRGHSKQLAKRVRERTAELRELQKKQKQSMLDISHGIQNPLTLLRAELETKQMQLNGQGKIYDRFISLVDRTSELAYELIALARLETLPKDGMKISKVDMSAIIRECHKALVQNAKKTGVKLTLKTPQSAIIDAVAGDMQRLIMNLLKNAIKYTSIKESNIKNVDITLSKNSKDDCIKIEIKDTGVGIPKESIPHLFDTFFRVNNTSHVEGAGIGLSIVKRIVEAHRGDISVHSIINNGTTFNVALPKRQAENNTNEIPNKQENLCTLSPIKITAVN